MEKRRQLIVSAFALIAGVGGAAALGILVATAPERIPFFETVFDRTLRLFTGVCLAQTFVGFGTALFSRRLDATRTTRRVGVAITVATFAATCAAAFWGDHKLLIRLFLLPNVMVASAFISGLSASRQVLPNVRPGG